MEYQIAQASPETGASNAADFQPPTRNPQNNPATIQQQDGVQNQGDSQNFLNDQRNSEISITRNPAPTPTVVRPTNDATGLALAIAIAIVVVIALVYRFIRRTPAPVVEQVESTITIEETEAMVSKPKKKPKKSKSTTQKAKKAKHRRH